VVGEEAVVVVDVLGPEPAGEEATVGVVVDVLEPEPAGEEAMVGVVVDVLEPEPAGEEAAVVVVDAAVVELPEEGAVVVAEPSPGAEAGGAEIVRIGELGPPAPGVLGALTAAGLAEEDGAALEDGTGALAAPDGGAPAGGAAPAAGCDPGRVTLRGSTTPETSGWSGERSGAGCRG
jgi:hypothetical protein